MKVGMAIAEPMRFHQKARNAAEAKEKTRALLEAVGLGAEYMERLPHTLSGGQKQRVCIARALSIEPRLLICDEIVSALDNTVQKAILDLLADLKQRFQLTIVFISHDLSVVRYLCGRVMVMHRGRIVESGHTAAVFEAPQDAYTRELLSAQL
jgi:peptide/nickel transport system ATP-binding protein